MDLVPYGGSYRAAVIGHTGQGDYGHALDTVFMGLPHVTVVAVADSDESGRAAARRRSAAASTYADYREMLAVERPDVVSVGPSFLDEHEAMVIADAEAGAKAIYCEKPIARSLDEADHMLAACDARGAKVAVAHQNRATPAPALVHRLIAAGKIGRLRTIRGYAKQDSRGGGLEHLIHGTHMFDLMRWFAGDARWLHARVCVEDQRPIRMLDRAATPHPGARDATLADAHEGAGELGLIAGDDIVVEVGFDHGVVGTFEAMRSGDGGGNEYLRMEVAGSAGVLAFWSGLHSPVLFRPGPFAVPGAGTWQRLELEAVTIPAGMNQQHPGNQVLVSDLLAAVEEGRPPRSSGNDARAALELILATYTAHLTGRRITLPLTSRTHPLKEAVAAR